MKHPGKLGALLIAALLGTSATAALAQSINVQKINPQGINHGANQLPQGKLQVRPPPRPNHGVNHEHLRSELKKQSR
jgi:hypothetical protein